jgi:hypothetical protein
VVPLQYPMSVDWGGSSSLAIGSGKAAIDAATRAHKVAILDPATRILTGLNRGSVTVSVTNDSMRAYTDDSSLAPITTSKTIEVVPATSAGVLSAGAPVFTNQPAGAHNGEVRKVTVTNAGTEPLKVTKVAITNASAADRGAFTVAGDNCSNRSVAPGHTCLVWVRFAPKKPGVTSTASLVFTSDTAAGTTAVPLTAKSTGLRWPFGGDGPAQDALPAGITWAQAQ